MFLRRFEADGDGFLFRASATDTPVRVSREERDSEAEAFRSLARWSSWGLVGGMIAVAIVMTFAFPDVGGDALDRVTWGSVIAMTALFSGLWWWGWRAPNRRFARRAPAGPARDRQEARAEALRRIGWGQLALGMGMALLLGARWFDGELVLPAVGGFVLVATAVQAVRKVMLERDLRP